jgi:integrase
MGVPKGENPNRPKPGSVIRVEPIRHIKDIQAIKRQLEDRPRDYALFVVGINTNLRASDLLTLKYEQFRDISIDGEVLVKEKNTKKNRRITLNSACIDAIQRLLASTGYKKGDFLFKGQQSKNISVATFSQMVKRWCKNLKGNYASHSLRKTWGYHQRVTYGVDIPTLMECFNHNTQRQTLDYLCIKPEEIKAVYLNEI